MSKTQKMENGPICKCSLLFLFLALNFNKYFLDKSLSKGIVVNKKYSGSNKGKKSRKEEWGNVGERGGVYFRRLSASTKLGANFCFS